ncbi:MAG: hypothetical protein IPJ47_17885 [Anaerolineales bacterium]|nr:hypothetical protein [Anaerolineales bacterium]
MAPTNLKNTISCQHRTGGRSECRHTDRAECADDGCATMPFRKPARMHRLSQKRRTHETIALLTDPTAIDAGTNTGPPQPTSAA